MSALQRRLSKLEARSGRERCPVVVKVFDPLETDDVEERVAEAERDATASGHQLLAIRIVDP
jgi:hypothetical protein